jgi:tRNA threonylcarbamoyladenosine biosynthesis protein TsaB
MSDAFPMKILALELSSPQRSVAVIQRGESPSGVAVNQVIELGSTAPFTMIEGALREAKLEREQIDCIVVGLGPGSYTGIRVAISIVQGWQLARGIKLLGVSSAECIAAQAAADGLTGRVNVIVDAQRGEFYLAGYDLADDTAREVEALKIITLEEVRQRNDAGSVFIGPEVSRWFPSGKTIFPRAATLGRLALSRTDFVPGEKLEPIYLRETQFVKAPPSRIIS